MAKKNLPDLIKEHKPKNIYNCDETELFYRVMPDLTLEFKGESCQKKYREVNCVAVQQCQWF